MDATDERAQRGLFMSNTDQGQAVARTIPIIQPPVLQKPVTSLGEPMDMTPPATAMMAPPARASPENEANGTHDHMRMDDQSISGGMTGPSAAAAAAAGAQQPKVVQTAFIHKLYK